MLSVKSLEDLEQLRETALEKRKETKNAQVIVAMGTCSIAVGARDTMRAIQDYIDANHLPDISVTQTGCIGLCEKEPVIQVVLGEQPKVTYGKVTPAVAQQIMKQHVTNGQVVKEHVIFA